MVSVFCAQLRLLFLPAGNSFIFEDLELKQNCYNFGGCNVTRNDAETLAEDYGPEIMDSDPC